MNQEFIEEQFLRLFRQSEIYFLYKILQSVGLKWLIDWYRTPFKHFKIKDKTKFESFLDKIGAPKKFLDKIAAYGFYSDFENPNLVIVRHNEITQRSVEQHWLNFWLRYQQKNFIEGSSFLKRLYFVLEVQKQHYFIQWEKNGAQMIIREPYKARRFMKVQGDMRAMLNYYGFTGSNIRYRHPFIVSTSPLKVWVLTQLLTNSHNQNYDAKSMKLLGIQPGAQVQYKPIEADIQYKIHRQRLKKKRNKDAQSRQDHRLKNVPRFEPFYEPIIQPIYQTVLKQKDTVSDRLRTKEPFIKIVDIILKTKPPQLSQQTQKKKLPFNDLQPFTSALFLFPGKESQEVNKTFAQQSMNQKSALFTSPQSSPLINQIQKKIKEIFADFKQDIVRFHQKNQKSPNNALDEFNPFKIISLCNQILAQSWMEEFH